MQFYLNNRAINQELNVNFCGHRITYDKFSDHLGVTLDRISTYKHHLEKIASKWKTRTILVSKLPRTTCGANTYVLRTISIVISIAEYCSSVWEGSTYCRLVDTEMQKSLRIITGTEKPTRIQWLPVLANIEYPHIRRRILYCESRKKFKIMQALQIHKDGVATPRLKSRQPFLVRFRSIKIINAFSQTHGRMNGKVTSLLKYF